MAKKSKGRPPSKAMQRHRAARLNTIGKRLFTEAEAAGVEPETLAANPIELEGIKVFEDNMFTKYWEQLELRPAFRRSM